MKLLNVLYVQTHCDVCEKECKSLYSSMCGTYYGHKGCMISGIKPKKKKPAK